MPDGCAWRPRETCTSEFQGGNRRVRNPPVAGTASLFSDETSTILTGSLEARCRRTMRNVGSEDAVTEVGTPHPIESSAALDPRVGMNPPLEDHRPCCSLVAGTLSLLE